jgi:hypothetical protein
MLFATKALRPDLLKEGLARAATAGRVTDLKHERWVQDGWCWAAVTTMVHLALNHEYRPQCHWAERLSHRTCCGQEYDCKGAEPVKDALDLENHSRPCGVIAGGLTFERIKTEIPAEGKGRPIVCTQPGHTLVLVAWEIDPIDGDCVYWADPAEGGEEWAVFVEGKIKSEPWVSTFLTQ